MTTDNINEISSTKLRGYIEKSRESRDNAKKERALAKKDVMKYGGMKMDTKARDDASRKVTNRNSGISVANRKLNTYPKDKVKAKVMARESNLISFGTFLKEEKISQDKLERALIVFKRFAEKRLKTKFYRFAGPKGYCEINKGIGVLYFYNKVKALRFNYVNGEIVSVTLWKNYKLGTDGDYTIYLDGLGILSAGKKLLDAIAAPKVGSMPIYADITESFLTEAKRVTPHIFYDIVSNTNFPAGESISSCSWPTLSDAAIDADVQIPTVVKGLKVSGKGSMSRFDLTKLVSGDAGDPEEVSTKSEPIYYLKITAQDPSTKKFLSVKGDKAAEQMLKQMSNAIDNPDVKTEMKDPDSLFGIMSDLTKLVCRGSRNSLVIYGGPGIGKTYVVTQTIKDEGLVKNEDWFVVKGKITTTALYQTLFMHREHGLLVFDDTDSVWGDQEAANVLKAALDSYDERTISWLSARTVNVSKMKDHEREEYNAQIDAKIEADPGDPKIKLPSEFNYNGRIIFISNLAYEKFDSAVLTRSAKIDMTLTDAQIFHRMESIIENLGDKSVSIDVKKEILQFLKDENEKGLLSGASMRTFVAAEDVYKSGMPNWRELLNYV